MARLFGFAAGAGAGAGGTAAMLRRLRVKFIALNMTLAALVLTGSFAAICYMDWRGDIDDVHHTLAQAVRPSVAASSLVPGHDPFLGEGAEDDGPAARGRGEAAEGAEGLGGSDSSDGDSGAARPDQAAPGSGSIGRDALPKDDGTAAAIGTDGGAPETDGEQDDADAAFAPPVIGGGPHADGESSLPVAVYFFTGNTASLLVDRSSATVSENLLRQALPTALHAAEPWGYLPEADLYFARHDAGPDAIVAFADGSAADGWQSLAVTLALACLGALAVLFLLNLAFSRWALRPVQRAWNQQQQFVADASHELKTPLTVILANNAILREHGADTVASQGQWLESTQVEAERMQGLVADMLDLARGDAEAGAPVREAVDFSRLVEGELLTFESVAFERGIAWEDEVEAGVTVRGDGRRLSRLVGILLDNACKYTEPGGQVQVALRREERTAALSVRNSGEAIAPEDLAHLFDRFYRADKARTHHAPAGYGLGLAIAQDIAQAHKATLTVRSNTTEGTVFTLKLPLT